MRRAYRPTIPIRAEQRPPNLRSELHGVIARHITASGARASAFERLHHGRPSDDVSDETCHHKMRDQLETILSEEGEQPDVANRLAVNTTLVLAHGRWALAHSGFHPHRVSIIVFSSNGKATNASFGSLAVRRGLLAAQIT